MTKQYFRKADGVVVMYDVTSERSYLNVRQWMDSVQVSFPSSLPLSVVGGSDLCC